MGDYLIPPRLGIDDFPKHLQRIYHLSQQEKETQSHVTAEPHPSQQLDEQPPQRD